MLLRQLLEVCPDDFINRPDKHGWFPLHILANNKDRFGVKPGMISVLCKANADVNVAKGRGMTPLMCAVSTAHIDAAEDCADVQPAGAEVAPFGLMRRRAGKEVGEEEEEAQQLRYLLASLAAVAAQD